MHIQPKKSLGQNFLFDKNIQRKIILNIDLKPSDIVLEIGSGRGELTRLMVNRVSKLYCVEIDPRLCKILEDEFKNLSNTKIINGDILKLNLSRNLARINSKIKVIGNIPYYISTPILERLILYRKKLDCIFITVQKEFAKRLIARAGSGEYGSLSCFVQYYFKPKILFNIKKASFMPMPKVDSSLVRLEVRKEPAVKTKDEELLFRIIRAAFNKRRKTLRNSLKDIVSPKTLENFFRDFSLDANIRPERLSLEDFANLANSKIS